MTLTELEKRITDYISFSDRVLEQTLNFFDDFSIRVASKIGPWLVPITPAYFIGNSLMSNLEAPFAIAFITALAIEAIGISSMNTTLKCYNWNAKKRTNDPRALLELSIGLSVFYLVVGILLAAGLEIYPNASSAALALFVLLTGVGSINLAINSDLTKWEALIGEELGLNKIKRTKLTLIKILDSQIEAAQKALNSIEVKVSEYKITLAKLEAKKTNFEAKVVNKTKSKRKVKPTNTDKLSVEDRRAIVNKHLEEGLSGARISKINPDIKRSDIYNDIKKIKTNGQ